MEKIWDREETQRRPVSGRRRLTAGRSVVAVSRCGYADRQASRRRGARERLVYSEADASQWACCYAMNELGRVRTNEWLGPCRPRYAARFCSIIILRRE